MKKTKLIALVTVLLFLLLSVMYIAPIKAMTTLSSMPANSDLQILPIENQNGFQCDGWKIITVNESSTEFLINITNPEGLVTTLLINKTSSEDTLTVNGVETQLNQPLTPTMGSSDMPSINIASAPSSIGPSLGQSINQTLSSIIGTSSLPFDNNTFDNNTLQTANPSSLMRTTKQAGSAQLNGANLPNAMQSALSEIYNPCYTYFQWDTMNFVSGENTNYPHDDKSAYNISAIDDWAMSGANLLHAQLSHAQSQNLPSAGQTLIDEAIGDELAGAICEYIVALTVPEILIIGGLIAAAFDIVINYIDSSNFLDEDGCLWFWISSQFFAWLGQEVADFVANWWDPFYYSNFITQVSQELWSFPYLRIGDYTYFNSENLNDPAPPQYWANSEDGVYTYSPYNPSTASTGNENALCGQSPDNDYATIYAGNSGD